MAYVLAGLMAMLAFLVNKFLFYRLGPAVIVTWTPAAEEALKTLSAYWLGGDIFLTHVTFGLIEGAYDVFTARYGWTAAAGSVVGHAVFGAVTVALAAATGSVAAALAVAVLVHLAWNRAAVLLACKIGRR